tara:strand:+ start:609 stop:788 length:180 start_codon:yes stop_codon:yes gene_type:complete
MKELKNYSKFYVIYFILIEVLEIMISKITELEAVTFLKYDDHIQSIKEGNKLTLKSKIS